MIRPCTLILLSVLITPAVADDHVSNGNFSSGLKHWTLSGNTEISDEGYDGTTALQLIPTSGTTAQAVQTISGLSPRNRYTIAAKVRTSNRLCPPILGIRQGVQIEKAAGYTAIEEVDHWVEERFEFFTADSTSVELVLQAWQTSESAVINFDNVRLLEGRQPRPEPEDWQGVFTEPPAISTQPDTGDNLIINGSFAQDDGGPWALGIEAEIVDTTEGTAVRLTSTEDTSRATQSLGVAFPPNSTYIITASARVEPGVVASIYMTGSDEFSVSLPVSNTDWSTITLQFDTGDEWINNPKLFLENWKNQPGAAWFTNVTMLAHGTEWSATTDAAPEPQLQPFQDDFSSGQLAPEHWLLSAKSWGGDNGGVSPENISLVHDIDEGEPIIALRLQANGDLYDGPIEENGRSTRVGAAIATRQYFASGRYEVRAKVAPELGVVTAFWPFHYIDYYPSQEGHWHEPNPRRNTEIDWEFPTDLRGNEAEAEAAGLEANLIAFTNARTNSWGGQFGGEGGEHKGRRILRSPSGAIVDVAQDSLDGLYHTYTIEWHSGSDLGDNGDTRDEIGCVRWYFDELLVDELLDVEYGQGNVPFRAARFWLGAWFPASGYLEEVGWGGSPTFNSTELLIASVSITPFNEPRDVWVAETVPNLAWATPDAYPQPLDPDDPCPADVDDNGRVDVEDLLTVIGEWGSNNTTVDIDGDGHVGVGDLLLVIASWGICPEG